MLDDLTVLLSAAGSPTMPGQIRCFRNNGERNIRIIGIDMSDDATIEQMVDKFYVVPPVSSADYVDRVLEICKTESVQIYFTNISDEVEKVSERISEFENIGVIVSAADISVIRVLNNKLNVYKELKENSILVPNFYSVKSIEEFESGCKELGYPKNPVCLKMVSNSGSRGVRIIDAARNRYEIFAHEKPNSFFTSYDDMLSILKEAKAIDEMMLVEYMPGNEYTVDLLAQDGEILYIAGREDVVSSMSIAQKSVVAKIDSAYEICEQIVRLFRYTGNIGFDFMKDQTGVPMLMDINPRLTATVSVIAAAGINLPYLRVKQLLGEDLPKCNLRYGTTLVRRYGEYMISPDGEPISF